MFFCCFPSKADPEHAPSATDAAGPAGRPAPQAGVCLASIRLLHTQEEISSRISAGPVSNYCTAVESLAVQYWAVTLSRISSSPKAQSATGVSVAIAVKPNGQSRAWSEAVGAGVSAEQLQEFDRLVEQLPVPVVVGGPIALAVELSLCGADAEITFPELPTAWLQFTKEWFDRHAGEGFQGTDALLVALWPDSDMGGQEG